MKILLLEYITAGGFCAQPLPPSLLCEGTLMRDALLADFSEIADVEIFTTYDTRVSLPKHTSVAMPVDVTTNVMELWQKLLHDCDAALLIAPESDGILSQLTQLIESIAVKNLGCKLAAVTLFTDKYSTYQALKEANILTIPTYTASDFLHTEFFELDPFLTCLFNKGCVAKPIDGAGCGDTYFFENASVLRVWLNAPAQISQRDAYIVQPYIAGTPASISMLCKDGKAWLLSCNEQLIEIGLKISQEVGHEFGHELVQKPSILQAPIQYKGSLVNGLMLEHVAFKQLAETIATTFCDLNGYVGVDVIMNEDIIYVVEVNPRITSSYIALHESLNVNPAKLILGLADDENSTFKLPENMAANKVLVNLNE